MTDHLPTENLTKSMLAGLTWQYASVFSQAFLHLFIFAALARLLSPADFGLMSMAAIFVGFAELFSQLGVGPAIIQHRQLTPVHIRVGFTLSILSGIVMVLVLWAVAPTITLFFHNDQLTRVLDGVSLDFFLGSFGVVAEALLKRKLQFKKLMWLNVGSYTFGYALIGITLAWRGYGVWALVGATLSQSLLKSILLLSSQPHPVRPSFARREFRDLAHFGGGFTLARLFNYSANQGDYFVVGRVLGAEPLGIYTRAYRLMMLPGTYFGQVLDSVLFPVMARIQLELPRLTRTYLTGIAIISLVSAPTGVLMVIMAPEIVNVILGPKWSETIIPFQILAIGVLPRVSYKIDDSLARALGAVYRRSVRDAIYAVAVVSGAWIGLHWGLPGVAVGVLSAVILNNIMAIKMSLRLLNCSWSEYVKAQTPGVFLAVVVALVALPIRSLLHVNGWPSWFILVITTLISGLSLAGLFFWRPQMLGIYGTGALRLVFQSVPTHFLPGIVSQWLNAKIMKIAV